MELGAGVHGEAGIAKTKIGTAKEIVKMILNQVTLIDFNSNISIPKYKIVIN